MARPAGGRAGGTGHAPPCPASTRADERGSGTLATVAGVAVFLGFLLLAVQVAVHLYATTVVTAAAFDAARIASGSGSQGDTAEAQAHFDSLLGRWASEVDLTIRELGDDVIVDVRGSSPAILPRTMGRVAGLGDIERSIRIRGEDFR